jgi:hypothetical protein
MARRTPPMGALVWLTTNTDVDGIHDDHKAALTPDRVHNYRCGLHCV